MNSVKNTCRAVSRAALAILLAIIGAEALLRLPERALAQPAQSNVRKHWQALNQPVGERQLKRQHRVGRHKQPRSRAKQLDVRQHQPQGGRQAWRQQLRPHACLIGSFFVPRFH